MIKKSCTLYSKIGETEHAKRAMNLLESGKLDGLSYTEKNQYMSEAISVIDGKPVVVVESFPECIEGEYSTVVTLGVTSTCIFESQKEKLMFLLMYGNYEMFNEYPIIRELSNAYYHNSRKMRPEGELLRKMHEFIGE